jgi:uncharacterized protein YgbK (DUF1537 family)
MVHSTSAFTSLQSTGSADDAAARIPVQRLHEPLNSGHLAKGPVLIASSATPDEVAALQARHGRDAAGHAIKPAMADIAEGLMQSGVRRLVVVGGETSGAVVDRPQIPGFLVGAEIAAGGAARRRYQRRRDAACT